MSIGTRTVLVFTDGSWEDSVAGIGAIPMDESSGNRLEVQDQVQAELLELWRDCRRSSDMPN